MKHLLPRLEFLLQALFRSQRVCPHCRGGDTRVVARKYLLIRIRRCSNCLLGFTDPIYRSVFTKAFYEDAYDEKDLTTRMPDADELAALKASLFAGTNKDFSVQIGAMQRLAPGACWAEIGSSWGYFVFQARARSIDAIGTEPDRRRRAYGTNELGVPLFGTAAELKPASFDLVFTHHVLEHFTDLGSIFNELHQLLRPGGVLVVEVPNVDIDTHGRHALAMIGAVHPMGFDRKFFAASLPRHGFDRIAFHNSYEDLSGIGDELIGSSLIVVARRSEC